MGNKDLSALGVGMGEPNPNIGSEYNNLSECYLRASQVTSLSTTFCAMESTGPEA